MPADVAAVAALPLLLSLTMSNASVAALLYGVTRVLSRLLSKATLAICCAMAAGLAPAFSSAPTWRSSAAHAHMASAAAAAARTFTQQRHTNGAVSNPNNGNVKCAQPYKATPNAHAAAAAAAATAAAPPKSKPMRATSVSAGAQNGTAWRSSVANQGLLC
jgi:hypothetical protein